MLPLTSRDFTFEFSEAQTDYEARVLGQASRAIGLAPDNPRIIKAYYLARTSRPSEALGVADAGLAINPNFAPLLGGRIIAELFLGRFEQAKSDAERAMRLSPRDPYIGEYHTDIAHAELGLGHFDAAIDEYRKAIDLGLRRIHLYAGLSAAYAQAGKMDEAKAVLAELRRLNPSYDQMDGGAPAEPIGHARRPPQSRHARGVNTQRGANQYGHCIK